MRGIRVDYGGVAVGAKESFVPDTADKAFDNLSDLQKEGTVRPNYGNPCELYSVILDGSAVPVPDNSASGDLGWWSDQISGADGKFADPIVLTLTSDEYFTSSGITLTFDTYNGIFANEVVIGWYRDGVLIGEEKAYTPDSAFYFCKNKAENYNKIIITFYSINMPYNRLKLRSIEYGMQISFYGDELRKCKIIQEIDPISTQIAINTCDLTLDSKRNIEYSFEERQPVSVYFNDILRATTFVKTAKRKSKNVWDITTEDYIGLMENVVFYGDIYKGKSSDELFDEIFAVSKVPYEITGDVPDLMLYGYIPYTNCREALMQVAFAVGAIIDTSNSDKVRIYMPPNEDPTKVTLDRIMQGQNFDDESVVTAVEVVSHEYVEVEELVTAYDATQSGIGTDIFVKFSQPLDNLIIVNGTKKAESTNYAIIDARAGCKLYGNKYEDRQVVHRMTKEFTNAAVAENIVRVENATLVSASNVQSILGNIFKYYDSNFKVNLKIVEGRNTAINARNASSAVYGVAVYGEAIYGGTSSVIPTKVGDLVECETEYLGDITGRIIKQTFNLNGGIIIKDTTVKKGV